MSSNMIVKARRSSAREYSNRTKHDLYRRLTDKIIYKTTNPPKNNRDRTDYIKLEEEEE